MIPRQLRVDAEKTDKLRTRLNLAVLDARNLELNNLTDLEQMTYLSAVLIDLIGCFYGMITVAYETDLQKSIGLAQGEIRKSIVGHYVEMKKLADNEVD